MSLFKSPTPEWILAPEQRRQLREFKDLAKKESGLMEDLDKWTRVGHILVALELDGKEPVSDKERREFFKYFDNGMAALRMLVSRSKDMPKAT